MICDKCKSEEVARIYRDSYLEIDWDARRVTVNGQEIELPLLSWKLLTTLVQNQGKAVSTEDLLLAGWGSEYGEKGLANWQMGQLRASLRKSGIEPPIYTVRGHGYRWEGVLP